MTYDPRCLGCHGQLPTPALYIAPVDDRPGYRPLPPYGPFVRVFGKTVCHGWFSGLTGHQTAALIAAFLDRPAPNAAYAFCDAKCALAWVHRVDTPVSA